MLSAGLVTLFYTFHLHRKIFIGLLISIPIAAISYICLDIHTDPMTFTSRFPVWHSAIKYTFKNPYSFMGLIGYGPDSYRNFTPHKNFQFAGDNFYQHGILAKDGDNLAFQYYSITNNPKERERLYAQADKTNIKSGKFDFWDNPHSDFIKLFFEYGLLGIALLIGLLREMIVRFRYTIKDKELIVVTSCLLAYLFTSIGHFPMELARLAYLFPLLLGVYYAKTDTV